MANITRFTRPLWDLETFYVFDDFTYDQTDLFWVDTITDTGTVGIGDTENGVALLTPSDGSVADNDETYFATSNELFLVEANRSLYARGKIQFAEANTDDANIVFGFMSAVAANAIVDDGAGLRITGNWFAIYKVDGETVWRCNSRNGTGTGSGTALGIQSLTTAGGTSYQTLEIFVHDFDGGTNVEVTYKVDGVYLRDANANGNPVIVHRILIASSTEMQLFFGVKNGFTNLETLSVDYAYGAQTRNN